MFGECRNAAVPLLGFRTGDLVLAIDGRRVTSAAQLGELLNRARAKAVITLQRDAQVATLDPARRQRRTRLP